MTGTQCIAIILMVRVVQQYTSKNSSILLPKTLYGNTKYFMLQKLLAAVSAVILLLVSGEFSKIDFPTVIYSGLSGIMLVIASACGLYAMRAGTMALTSMFSTAGLIVPCIAGIILYDEKMSFMQWFGVVMFLGASFLLISSSKKMKADFSFKTVLLLVGSLLSNGVTMMLQTMFKREIVGGSVTAFSFLSFIIPALILLIFMGGYKLKTPEQCQEKMEKKLVMLNVVSAIALFIVNQLATMAADKVQPVVLFTFINGGNTIIAAVMAALMFKEKFTVKSVLGILLGLGALVIVKAF